MKWPVWIGTTLFAYRSVTPLPVMLGVFLLAAPPGGRWLAPRTLAGLLLALLGEAVRMLAVGYSAEGTSGREDYLRAESLNETGLYSLVRNPLYLGNLAIYGGLLLVYGHLLALVLGVALLAAQYWFIVAAEEDYLRKGYGEAFAAYCRRIPRFLPRLRRPVRPPVPFQWRKVLFKENDSLFNLLVVFLLVLAWRPPRLSPARPHFLIWILAFSSLVLLYLGIKIAKRRARREVS